MDTRENAFEKIMAYEKNLHAKNQKRIQIGIRMLLVIPLIFLAIMFKMESNKVIFLVLWIVSLFVIALYLILIEYMDYDLQMKLREFGIRDEDEKINGLIDDRMDMDRIMRVANAIQGSLSLEEKNQDNVACIEDKHEKDIQDRPKKKPRPQNEEGSQSQRRKEQRKDTGETDKYVNGSLHKDQMKEVIDQIGVEAAEEELMASIKRYVAEVNAGNQTIVVEPKKSAKDYAQMRKKRAKEKERFENEEE